MKELNDIHENIEELRDRIKSTLEFPVAVKYFNRDEELISKQVNQEEFLRIIDVQKEESLWSMISENEANFIQAIFLGRTDLEHNLEKLLIEIDKIPLILKTKSFEEKPLIEYKEIKTDENIGEEIPEEEPEPKSIIEDKKLKSEDVESELNSFFEDIE
jgi:hypothetical protein